MSHYELARACLTGRSTGRAGTVLQLGESVVGAPVNLVR